MNSIVIVFALFDAVTLTTRYALGRRQFSEAIEQRYVRRLARMAQHRIAWFAVFEPTMAGQWHSHLLLGGTQGTPTAEDPEGLDGWLHERRYAAGPLPCHPLRDQVHRPGPGQLCLVSPLDSSYH